MMKLLWVFIAFTLTSRSHALPLVDSDIAKRQNLCNGNPKSVYDASCFGELKLGDFLKDWEKKTPRCGPGSDGIDCCGRTDNPQEWWSTCFLQLSLDNSGPNCQYINVKTCNLENAEPKVPDDVKAQHRYIVRNIYVIQSLFTNWFLATKFASSQAALLVPDIISKLDPDQKTKVALTKILTAFTAGLSFLGLPGVVLDGAQTAAKTAINAISIGVQQTPGVAKAIWPSGTVSSQIVQMGELQAKLGSLDADLTKLFNDGLFAIMANVDNFISFASSGQFSSGQDVLNLPDNTAGLDAAFKTYIVTAALRANSYVAFTRPDYGESQLSELPGLQGKLFGCTVEGNSVCDFPKDGAPRANNNPAAPAGSGNNRQVPGYGQPAKWAMYTSKSTHRPYHPQSQKDIDAGPSASSNDVANWLADNRWGTTPEAVFDGGYECTNGGGAKDKPLLQIGNEGKINFNCLSQLEVKSGCTKTGEAVECAEFAGLGSAQTPGAGNAPIVNPATGGPVVGPGKGGP